VLPEKQGGESVKKLPLDAEAVVFDCDGLLVDTEACWTRAGTGLFAAHGRAS
jgi:hypothetical protein